MNFMTKCHLAMGAAVCAMPLHAALVLQDNMNYGASDVAGAAAATVGDWNVYSNRIVYRTGTNLVFSGDADYVNSTTNSGTGAFERTGGANVRYAYRDYSDAGLTGEVWMSTVVRLTNPAAGYSGLSFNTTAETGTGYDLKGDAIGIGYNGGVLSPVWVDLSNASSKSFASNTLSANSTVLMVAKLNIGAGADSFSMWVFDSASSFGLTEASLGAAHLSSSSADFGDQLDKIQLGGDSFQSYYDQIRISSLSGDAGLQEVLAAVPEPSVVFLSGLGVFFLLRRRRCN